MGYHNTIPLPLGSEDYNKKQARAAAQEKIILAWFLSHPGDWTPCEVWQRCLLAKATPITSIRRAITDLTKKGLLKKTGKKRRGIYGDLNNTWTIKREDA